MLTHIVIFLAWTLVLYCIHRITHKINFINKFHQDHHCYINKNKTTKWHWNNLFLYNDTWKSTVDLWITEVIPTLLFSIITGHWWVIIFYYIWAAVFQETIEHNPKINLYPFITSGKWHLIHHRHQKSNFGLFIPIWDILFGTYKAK